MFTFVTCKLVVSDKDLTRNLIQHLKEKFRASGVSDKTPKGILQKHLQ